MCDYYTVNDKLESNLQLKCENKGKKLHVKLILMSIHWLPICFIRDSKICLYFAFTNEAAECFQLEFRVTLHIKFKLNPILSLFPLILCILNVEQ